MACFHSLQAFRKLNCFTDKGKSVIVFHRPMKHGTYEEIELPCGQCVGCRLERSRQWAVRCLHESRLHDRNCFITLTFNDESLNARPNPATVDVRDFQLFMKRLRFRFGQGIRFFHCGEYGELYGRPHYHACLFGFDFPDKVHWKTVNEFPLYTSKILQELWPYGFSSIGSVSFESAAYVARYIMKKINGEKAFEHYTKYDRETGEILLTRKPEYVTMSRRKGIGKLWIDKYLSDVYVNGEDSVMIRGLKLRPPKYYDSQFEIISPSDLELIKLERKRKAALHADDCTPARLRVREKVQLARLKKLPRNVE
jgi:hypothetical protein